MGCFLNPIAEAYPGGVGKALRQVRGTARQGRGLHAVQAHSCRRVLHASASAATEPCAQAAPGPQCRCRAATLTPLQE